MPKANNIYMVGSGRYKSKLIGELNQLDPCMIG